MKNTTISLDEDVLEAGRGYAQRLGVSFNAWIKKLITDAVSRAPADRMRELLELSDRCAGNSRGKRWNRDELYER